MGFLKIESKGNPGKTLDQIRQYMHGKMTSSFGIPLVSRLCNSASGSDICNLYLKLLKPFQTPRNDSQECLDSSESATLEEVSGTQDTTPPVLGGGVNSCYGNGADSPLDFGFQFYITDEKGTSKDKKIVMIEIVEKEESKQLNVLVCWPKKYIAEYDTRLLSSLAEVFKSSLFAKKPQESVSLYKCLEAFLKEEPLGPEDVVSGYCPGCKKHCQASKKLDLWRLPEILVIHLKRFSYSRCFKNKLETYVDFPDDNLDLSTYIAYRSDQLCNRYMLCAKSNRSVTSELRCIFGSPFIVDDKKRE
ncbi:hypothetical protein GBA52_003640 [Prunus armeniaca]|nr:hypothetical protein GBA52_003640 [Prunus armeniaca]